MTEGNKNYYGLLGLEPSATRTEIQDAFLEEVRACHPDLNPGMGNERFMEIAEAYEVLSDPTFRPRYDDGKFSDTSDNVELRQLLNNSLSKRMQKWEQRSYVNIAVSLGVFDEKVQESIPTIPDHIPTREALETSANNIFLALTHGVDPGRWTVKSAQEVQKLIDARGGFVPNLAKMYGSQWLSIANSAFNQVHADNMSGGNIGKNHTPTDDTIAYQALLLHYFGLDGRQAEGVRANSNPVSSAAPALVVAAPAPAPTPTAVEAALTPPEVRPEAAPEAELTPTPPPAPAAPAAAPAQAAPATPPASPAPTTSPAATGAFATNVTLDGESRPPSSGTTRPRVGTGAGLGLAAAAVLAAALPGAMPQAAYQTSPSAPPPPAMVATATAAQNAPAPPPGIASTPPPAAPALTAPAQASLSAQPTAEMPSFKPVIEACANWIGTTARGIVSTGWSAICDIITPNGGGGQSFDTTCTQVFAATKATGEALYSFFQATRQYQAQRNAQFAYARAR